MRILISGAGIAGPTLAYWLLRHGFEPTLVERASQLRTGGYAVDFWGVGYDVAEWMGIIPELRAAGYDVKELRMVGPDGRRISGFPVQVLRRILKGRYLTVGRSLLASAIHGALGGRVETIFGDTIVGLQEDPTGVEVRFERSAPRRFDLVVGADGLHSAVRRLVFGPPETFEHYLGCRVAAFEVRGYRPRDEDVYVLYTQVGWQIDRFSLRDDRTLFLLVFADPRPDDLDGQDAEATRALLRRRFSDGGWECRAIMEAMDGADSFYLDRVSQVQMPAWSAGRVALVGDAAFCPSLLAGQGSALAMMAAYVLAGELKAAGGDHRRAFAEYQHRLGAFLRRKQDAARSFVGFFAPRSRLGVFVRNHSMSLLKVPYLADLLVGRDLADRLPLPSY
jgi:2-polyprenyl-6-methoxyphenol hydroxylase-like FAD-dependent oxidoreductase